MIKIGIAGCGQITKVRHAPEYAANENCILTGFFDVDVQRATKMAELYKAEAYSSYEELLEHVDAVSVCVANKDHCEYTIKALNAGKHVLCEKPMAVKWKECKEMTEVAHKNGRKLVIAQNQRFNKAHQKARELITAGEIGKIIGFKLVFGHAGPESWSGEKNPWFFDKSKAAFGAMADLGIHKLDLMCYLTASEVKTVSATLATVDKKYPNGSFISVDDNAYYVMQLENGAIGTVHASWTFYAAEDNSSTVYGTEGYLQTYFDPEYSLVLKKINGEKIFMKLDEMMTNADQRSGTRTNTGVIDAFIDSILTGKDSISAADTVLNSMKVVFAGEKSAIEKRVVSVDEIL